MQIETCPCGSELEVGYRYCRACGRSLSGDDPATALGGSFEEDDDAPTHVAEPDFLAGVRSPLGGPSPAPARVSSPSGFRSGLLVGFGLAGGLFGLLALAGAGVIVARYGMPAVPRAELALPAAMEPPAPVTVAAAPEPVRAVERTDATVAARTSAATSVAPVAAVVPAPIARIEPAAKLAPTTARPEAKPATPGKPEPKAAAPAPNPVVAEKAEPKPVAKAEPAKRTAPEASPARPSREELLALAHSAREKAAPAAAPAHAPAAPPPSALWSEPEPVPRWEPVDDTAEVLVASGRAAAPVDPDLADLFGDAPASKVSAPSAKTKVIRSRKGNRSVALDANIALTRADGKTVVGTLLSVDGGFIEVKTANARLTIAEKDVLDAATY